jgi:diacylglycerol kinase (ATP)
VAMGGDGTLCQVAEALMHSKTPMAGFPQGTGNLFARTYFAVPTYAEFAHMITRGSPQGIDMIRLNYNDQYGNPHERLFMVMLGIGTLSDAVSKTSAKMKAVFGKLAYSARVFRAALSPTTNRFRITSGGRTWSESGTGVNVYNVLPPKMAMMSRGCSASDGLMDVGIITAQTTWQLLKMSVYTALGRPVRSGYYHTLRTRSLSLECVNPVNPNIDGDPSHMTHRLELAVVPQAVNMVVAA